MDFFIPKNLFFILKVLNAQKSISLLPLLFNVVSEFVLTMLVNLLSPILAYMSPVNIMQPFLFTLSNIFNKIPHLILLCLLLAPIYSLYCYMFPVYF